MKKTFALGFGMIIVSLMLPFGLAAQGNPPTDGGQGSGDPGSNTFQLVPCDNKTVKCDFNALMVGVNRIIKLLLFLSIPLVMGMILYTGYKYMAANGDPGKLADAKKMFIPVALGIFWILAAYLSIKFFLDKLVNPNISQQAKDAIKILDNSR